VHHKIDNFNELLGHHSRVDRRRAGRGTGLHGKVRVQDEVLAIGVPTTSLVHADAGTSGSC